MKKIILALFIFSNLIASITFAAEQKTAKATFAGGCFWCMEEPFDKVDGVISTTSGYTGGKMKNPTYEQVSMGGTGHAEAVEIVYDPSRVTYEKLLEVFWTNVDATDGGGQFCDRGDQYRSEIYFHDEKQKAFAEKSKQEKAKLLKQAIVTPITAATQFYPAEEYHQDFYKKSTFRYKTYRMGCGRDRRLQELWGAAAKH